jgi:capsular exopolysaccharide synthesis family protein
MSNSEIFDVATEEVETTDIKLFLMRYVRYWYVFLLGIIISVGLAHLYLRYYAVPQYKVYSTMLIKDDENGQSLSNVDALSDLSSFKSHQSIDNQIEVLKSKGLMERVVSELDLSIAYFVKGSVKDIEVYGSYLPIKVVPSKLDSTSVGQSFTITPKADSLFELVDAAGKADSYKFGQQITKPYGSFSVIALPGRTVSNTAFVIQIRDSKQVAGYYNGAVAIQLVNKNTSVLSLSLTDPIPERARNIINKLMEVYNREAIEDKSTMAANTLRFLDERIGYLTNDIVKVEKGVEQYKSGRSITDIPTQATDYTAQASTYTKQSSELAIQLSVLESIERYLRQPNSEYSTVPSSLDIKDETLVGLIGSFNALQLNRERMLRTIQPNSVLMQNANQELGNLKEKILENLQNIKTGLQITRNQLQKNTGQFESKIRQVPQQERELANISRQQEIKRNVYAYLLQKREETSLSLAATVAAARVLDPAMGGEFPISPNRQAIYLMALLFGLSLPALCIYGTGLLNNKVQTQQDVTTTTGLSVIGEIVHHKEKDKVVVAKGNRSPITEIFRLIRANLNFLIADKENVVLMVTSSMSGEGKTFFSINLAASMALTAKRVLLIDLDLRAAQVASYLQIPEIPGVSDYLTEDNVTLEDIIKSSDKIPNLSVITAGFLPSNPAELIMTPKFSHLLQELKRSFDCIIIDTPPAGLVAEAFTLNRFIDYTIYVVRYNYTFKSQLNIIRNANRQKSLKNLMVVMNDAKQQNGQNYGYGYGYGYAQDKKVRA